MTDDPKEAPYGERFAEAWAQLQRYLGDLDPEELERMATKDFEGTLKMLEEQPALGHSGALHSAAKKNPEELAVAIIRERLRALTDMDADGDDSRYGVEFLQAWKNMGGGVTRFRYATIQELKKADKDEAIEILMKLWGQQYSLRKILEQESPRAAARIVLARGYAMGGGGGAFYGGGFYGGGFYG